MTEPSVVVVDASVAVKWIILETGRESALDLLRRVVSGEVIMIAPRALMEEVASALSKRVRRKQLTATQARAAFRYFDWRRPRLVEDPQLLVEALDLSLRHHLSLWDSLYVALAVRLRCNLVTADERLHRGVSRHYPFVELLR